MSILRAATICLLATMLGGCPERYTRAMPTNTPGGRQDPECGDPCATTACPPGFSCSFNDSNCQPSCEQVRSRQ